MLNDPNPLRFLSPDVGRASGAIREHYRDQLRENLGSEHIAWRSVSTAPPAPRLRRHPRQPQPESDRPLREGQPGH